jgi:hypothetical protein
MINDRRNLEILRTVPGASVVMAGSGPAVYWLPDRDGKGERNPGSPGNRPHGGAPTSWQFGKSSKVKGRIMAHCKSKSKQSGKQCLQPAIPGGAVCRYHGGAAPQVIRRAQERLDALVDSAINQLARLLKSKSDAVVLNAVKDILDRCGYKAIERTQEVPYTPEDIERLDNLTDTELVEYIALRKKMVAATRGVSREQVH